MDKNYKNKFPFSWTTKSFPFSLILFLLTANSLTPFSLAAQELDPAFMVQLMNRMGALEEQNRELRGQLDEAHHELSTLSKRVETLSADIDYRLSNPDSGAPPSSFPSREGRGMGPDPFPLMPPSERGNSAIPSDYESARTLLEQGDYAAAERAFSAFLATHPQDKSAGPAQYWLGVTFFVRGQHEKAAAAFAKGYKAYPKSPKVADTLLKLVKSLSALDRKADACTILDQLSSEHPTFQVKDVSNERKKLGCK